MYDLYRHEYGSDILASQRVINYLEARFISTRLYLTSMFFQDELEVIRERFFFAWSAEARVPKSVVRPPMTGAMTRQTGNGEAERHRVSLELTQAILHWWDERRRSAERDLLMTLTRFERIFPIGKFFGKYLGAREAAL